MTATSSNDDEDQFNEDTNMHRIFREENVEEREAFRDQLRTLLSEYQDKA